MTHEGAEAAMTDIRDEPTVTRRARRRDKPWSIWRDPMTFVVLAAGIYLTVLTILG